MYRNFRGKNSKDTETAIETIIPNVNSSNSIINRLANISSLNVTQQQLSEDNFDTFIDKRK